MGGRGSLMENKPGRCHSVCVCVCVCVMCVRVWWEGMAEG